MKRSREILCDRLVKITDHSKLLKPIIDKYTHGVHTYCSETNPENCRLLLLTYRLSSTCGQATHTQRSPTPLLIYSSSGFPRNLLWLWKRWQTDTVPLCNSSVTWMEVMFTPGQSYLYTSSLYLGPSCQGLCYLKLWVPSAKSLT